MLEAITKLRNNATEDTVLCCDSGQKPASPASALNTDVEPRKRPAVRMPGRRKACRTRKAVKTIFCAAMLMACTGEISVNSFLYPNHGNNIKLRF